MIIEVFENSSVWQFFVKHVYLHQLNYTLLVNFSFYSPPGYRIYLPTMDKSSYFGALLSADVPMLENGERAADIAKELKNKYN